MGSRRTTPHSSLGNGRSSSGEDNGNSRPGSCSYLSNVRPENRSTLCSVIAQLTEETQPFFETTVRSKAVCENSNVKFSCVVTGYPTPLVIWYKEDMQLDRYCGLPKYEIFHDGQNHSLHIYNCTVEDAAIYQVSASNSKGIVSCAGVLEVGEMNELKIHEHYFAKIRQKAVLMRKEVEGKENQEPLRTISPERPQRKRRSTMEAYLNMPSSMGEEESQQAVVVETESRLQEATVGEAEEKSTPVTNGEALNDHGNKAGTFIYDSAQRLFTTLQPKIPFVKKKIKISSRPKIAKSDPLKEKASEERGTKQKAAGTKSQQSKGSSEEVMEVDNSVSSSVVDLYIRNVAEQHQKSATEEAMLMKRPSQDEDKCVVPQRKQLTASVSPAALTGTGQTVPGPKGKQAAKHEKKAGPKNAEESLGIQSQRPNMNPVQRQPSALPSLLKRHVTKTEDATVMDVDKKSNTSTGGSLGGSDLECMETTYESRTASTQRPSEQAEPQLSQKEPSQRLVSVPRPALHSKAHTKKNRNDAAVNLGLPPDQRAMDMQPPRKTPAERETTADDNKTLSLHNDLQAPIDKMTQNAWDHSSGSNESHTVPYTDLQKSSVESPGGENIRGCNVSPTTVQSQVDTVGESVEEMNVDENTEREEVDKLLDDSVAPDEKILELETENAALHMGGQNITEKARDAVDQGADFITAEASCKDTNELIISSELQNQKTDTLQTAMPHLTNNLENTNSLEQIRGFKEIPNTASKVISSAEQLRSQVKALDSMLPNSVHIDFVQEPSQTTREACQDLRGDERKYKLEMKQSNVETATDHTPPSNIKSVLQPHAAASPHVQAVIPPISVTDTGITVETVGVHGSTKKDHDGFTDIVVSVTESESVKHQFQPLTSKDTLTDILGSGTPTNASSQELGIALEHAKDGPLPEKIMELIRSLIPEIKLNSETEGAITEMLFSDQCKMEKHNTNTGSLSVEKFPTKSVFSTDTQESILQLDSSVAEEYATNNSLTNSTPEASPLLKKRDCVSPIPSATPQELASGARRKILMPRDDPEEATGATEATSAVDSQTQKLSTSPVTLPTSPGPSRRSPLLQPAGEQTPPVERRSPMSRRKAALEAPAPGQQPTEESHTQKDEGKPTERDKHDPFKAPQVIRKIRGETFTDVSGHMKLWCQFFNVLSDSTIKWYKNEEEIAQMTRHAGDETQVNLAIVQASCKDTGVYRCSITNEYGTDSTDLLLSPDILVGMSLHEDLCVGEEIEMTPLIFSKGVADSGVWGNKLFGRIMIQESHIGDGCSHKVWRAKVIYGLEPVFESGNTCIIKTCSPIAYGGKEESRLIDRNLDMIKQECKIHNLAREYCKIFSAEARAIENFGSTLEVLPVYLIYRPANTVPYATVEADLTGVYQKYCVLDHMGRTDMRTGSGLEQKCCALQHWTFQWTNGNLLLTRLEGVDTKITSVGIAVKSTGHQGLSLEGNPKVFEHFISQHQCNYFCGLLGLRSLKVMDALSTPAKPKGSRSPLLQRKTAAGSSSPQLGRKAAGSPRLPRKAEQDGRKTPTTQNAADAPKVDKTV